MLAPAACCAAAGALAVDANLLVNAALSGNRDIGEAARCCTLLVTADLPVIEAFSGIWCIGEADR